MNKDCDSIVFIGAGSMASAIIKGMLANHYPAQQITAIARSQTRLRPLAEDYGIHTSTQLCPAIQQATTLVLAVKPNQLSDLCTQIAPLLAATADYASLPLVISLAAGISLQQIKQAFLSQQSQEPHQSLNGLVQSPKIVRAMPNTPARIRQGMTGLYTDSQLDQAAQHRVQHLFSSIGQVCWLIEEAAIDWITAASGSGPAYFYLMMEAMQQMMMAQGFDQQQARQIVQQTAYGAAAMAIEHPQLTITELRQQVTSKGGTTAAAIATFEQGDFRCLIQQAMQSAQHRAQQL